MNSPGLTVEASPATFTFSVRRPACAAHLFKEPDSNILVMDGLTCDGPHASTDKMIGLWGDDDDTDATTGSEGEDDVYDDTDNNESRWFKCMPTKENISDVPSRELVDHGDVIKAINSDEVKTVLIVDEEYDDPLTKMIGVNDATDDGPSAEEYNEIAIVDDGVERMNELEPEY